MENMPIAERKRILEAISNLSLAAENEETDMSNLFVPNHYALLREPGRFLILGGRGAGKTRAFHALTTKDGFRKIVGSAYLMNAPDDENCNVIEGFSSSGLFPAPDILDHYATDKLARSYWIGSLLIVLSTLPDDGFKFIEIMHSVFGASNSALFLALENLKHPSRWINFVSEHPELWSRVLDEFDRYLSEQDRWAIIAYDDLDRLTSKFLDLFSFVRPLLSFWFQQLSRWERLRCKIFLRDDLYDSHLLGFPYAYKMGGRIMRLEWSGSSLYQLLIKKIANSSSESAFHYLNDIPGLIQEKDNLLGYIPSKKIPLLKEFTSRLVGEFMGDSPRDGLSYYWIPNHLQDGKGKLAPRPFIKCFSVAAQMMLERKDVLASLTGYQLILPDMISDALDTVSDDRLAELIEENPWLAQLKPMFNGLPMMMEKDQFIENIDMDLWDNTQKLSLPESTPQGIFSALQQLGIVFAHENCIIVPELYLHGFRMKHECGLRRISSY